jgi:hypothetical protein
VTDAVEIAMEVGGLGDGTPVARAVCARRAHGATCWTEQNGALIAADAPELASAIKLYSGPAICGAAASGAIRCVRLDDSTGYIAAFSEDDYETYAYRGSSAGVAGRIAHVLEQRLHAALAAKRTLTGFRGSDSSDPVGRTGGMFQPPIAAQIAVVQTRRIAWTVDWNEDYVRGALCVRHGDGVVACWGERDYLGAGQRSTRAEPVPVANVVMGPPRAGSAAPAPRRSAGRRRR